MNKFFNQKIFNFFLEKKLLWFFLLSFFPLLFLFSLIFSNYSEYQKNNLLFTSLIEKISTTKKQREAKVAFIERFKLSNTYFLQTELEPLVFRKKEISLLELLVNKGALATSSMCERLNFLKEKNHLKFEQLFSNKGTYITESEEKTNSSVEIAEEDLFTLLSYIEGVSINHINLLPSRPYLLIKKLNLKKGEGFLENTSLFLTLSLLKKDLNNE